MAKRKRLTPANPTYLGGPLEVKSMLAPGRAPVAQVAQDSAAAAALDEMADTLRRARDEGRMVLDLPLDVVEPGYLMRDRLRIDAAEMAALKTSIAARGQQTPIDVTALDSGRFGLISGWRRLQALGALDAEQPGAGFDRVRALVRQPVDQAESYVAMIEENEIRVGLSYYERARIAAKAVDQGVFETPKAALLSLYHAASRAKRSKIRSFLVLVDQLDPVLRFPEAIGERLGLRLAQALEADPALGPWLAARLREEASGDAETERRVLDAALKPAVPPHSPVPDRAPDVAPGVRLSRKGGRLTLEGPGVDAALETALSDWLRQRH